MAAIYLTHPKHGVKVATSEHEANHDKANGWSECSDPRSLVEKQEAAPAAPVSPSLVPGGLPPGLATGGAATGVTTFPPGLPAASELAADFPGRESLTEAGLLTWASLVGKSKEELMSIKGIGDATATEILSILEG